MHELQGLLALRDDLPDEHTGAVIEEMLASAPEYRLQVALRLLSEALEEPRDPDQANAVVRVLHVLNQFCR